ncbi:hypothetical protein OAI51_00665 [Candidatus Pelagibacter bacterium]|jgi:hypothetical protein|nr:hypothetical protein [Candidatus Pelagibacter bacterium]
MIQIHWKIKSLLYRLLNFFKLYKALFFIQKKITKRSNIDLKEIAFYWQYHLKYLKENNSKTILEIGAGKSLAQNIFLSYSFNQKIEQTLIDVSRMIDLDLFNKANDQISKLLGVNKLPFAKSIDDLKKNYNLNYLAPMSLDQIIKNKLQFDACISSTTLEHLSEDDLRKTFLLLKKIIKKEGIISAAIDYSDHYSHTDKNIDNLNFLRFTNDEWNKHNTPMLFQNRLRHQDYRKFFKLNKYKIYEIKGELGKCPQNISKEFDISNKETFILWGHFLLKF